MNLNDYDMVVVNTSAGKDSQTMLRYLVKLADSQDFPRNRMIAVHADLGRVEWPGTRELAEEQVDHYGLRFEAISRERGDLLDQVEARGMWPSSTTRYCTSDQKRDQIAKIITRVSNQLGATKVLNCMGFRAEESPVRSKKATLELNKRLSNKSREVWTWLPILDWTEDEVWADIRESGVRYHPAYDLDMPRLSCVFCIFAPKAALIVAGRNNPELLDEYVRVEDKINHTFRKDMSIRSIRDAIESGEEVGAMTGAWNM